MASLPSPTQVSGKHNAIYEAYYKQVDPKGIGTIEAMDAAKFLKKSGLSDVVLSRIWDLSDPKGRGCLDKAGFFVSLKLVALAQAGHDINMRNIFLEPQNPPKVGEIPKIIPQAIQSIPAANTDWSMKPTDRLKYEQLFESLQPVNGLIAGNKVKGVLMDSKLPLETLGKIWDLADQDKDGSLDKHEFIVAMHLVYQALDKRAVPSSLPVELQKPKPGVSPVPIVNNDSFGDAGFVANFPKDIAPPPVPALPAVMTAAIPPVSRVPPAVPTMPLIPTDTIIPAAAPPPPPAAAVPSLDWVVVPADRVRFEALFRDSDKDRDGLVSGLEVKNVFLQSGVPQNCLAHIWALCDTNQSGKLTVEQFALAMWMVERKKNGIEPPEALTPNMIPPSLRGAAGIDIPVAQPEPQPQYSNPELEMISKEIEELARERRVLETDIAQKEADIRIKSGEVRSLQSELDTLAATLKQLENQKGEAQKRLDDLKTQVNKIREQCQKQEDTINEQEGELNSKRSELQKLKDEESALEKEYESNRKELDSLTKQLQDTQLQISQVRAMVTQLLETQRQMTDALLLCKAAIEANDPSIVSEYSLQIQPDFAEAKATLEKQIHQPEPEPFHEAGDGFGANDAFASDSFNKTTNGFGSDPFSSTNGAAARTGFDDSFANAPMSGFDDSFNSGFTTANQTKDPFVSSNADPFGDKKSSAVTPEPGKDDFGSDPFAILHAPTSGGQILSPNTAQKTGPPPRPESPSPALPPKKSKQPPPRPAPPRPVQGPTRPAPPASDGFGSSGGFADFADFDNKLPTLSPPTIPQIQPRTTISTATTAAQLNAKDTGQVGNTIVSDFSEDPFKDYRYEDPFSIKDPFADDDDAEESSEDVFSDDSKKDNKQPTTTIPTPRINNNNTTKNDLVNNFKLNTSPVPSNANKITSSPPLATNENFEIFDSFDDPTSNTTTITTTTTNINSNNNQQPQADFFDAFNDNFKSVDNKNLKTNQSVFDAFGDSKITNTDKTTKSSKIFDAFDNFEDDFFKTGISDKSTFNSNLKESNGNFANFDGFDDDVNDEFHITTTKKQTTTIDNLNNTKNPPIVRNDLKSSKVKNDVNGAKVSDKFAEDYSKTDNFDADLQAVLQRSLVDQ